ncbi:MAG: hypothetical protein Q9165_002435 [Trypethelium subeluteriae]
MTQDLEKLFAIVGVSCRFPGGADNPEKLWSLLTEGRDAWSDVPKERFLWESFYHPNPDINGVVNHRGGHFLKQDVSLYDPSFFGISSAEAQAMDPQQRLQLETTYEALENAGIPIQDIQGSNTAVYMAIFSRDYERLMSKDPNNIAKYHMLGTGDAILANRVSHVFDFKGPSITIDTGCSGSMVALHQAILNGQGRCFSFDSRGEGYGRGEGAATLILKRLDTAVRDGDSIRAIVHGTGVNQDGKTSGIALPNEEAQQDLIRSTYQRAGLDPKDTDYVEAHGTGTIAGDAIETRSISNVFCRNRDSNHPLLVGSIKPNIGHLESASGLAGVIKTVLILEKGQIPPNLNLEELKPSIDLNACDFHQIQIPRRLESWPSKCDKLRFASVNSFGYGGTNGHAILSSVPAAFCTSVHGPLAQLSGTLEPSTKYLSNETNGFTNLDATANGINGLKDSSEINGLHSTNSTSENQQVNGNGAVTQRSMKDNSLTLAGISSPSLLVLSAKSEKSLLNMVNRLKHWAKDRVLDSTGLQNLSYTLCSRRSQMQWRYSSTIPSPNELSTVLDENPIHLSKSLSGIRTAFIFTGQGAQWIGMGRRLLMVQSKFFDSLQKSDVILRCLDPTSTLIKDLLAESSNSRVNESAIAQPTVTSLQIALVDLFSDLGIVPDIVLGHSSGEIAAAYTAGKLTHAEALKVSYNRGFISAKLRAEDVSNGGMIAIGLGEDDVVALLSRIPSEGSLSIACVNSPNSTTVSGDLAALHALIPILEKESISCQKLRVDIAYHSPHMQRVANDYRQRLKSLAPKSSHNRATFISTVSGTEKSDGFGPEYWVKNLVSKVRFADALKHLDREVISHLAADAKCAIIEIGPHSALSGPVRQTFASSTPVSAKHIYIPTLVRKKDALACVFDTVAKMWELGYPTKLEGLRIFNNPRQPLAVLQNLPPYEWDHTNRYWHESRLSREHRFRQFPYHDLLGLRVLGSSPNEPSWCNTLSEDLQPWLRDHAVDHVTVFPGSGYLCMAIEAFRQVLEVRAVSAVADQYLLRDVSFSKALLVPESPEKVEIQLSLRSSPGSGDKSFTGWEEFRISSVSQDGIWTEHCQGSIGVEFQSAKDDTKLLFQDDSSLDEMRQHSGSHTSADSEIISHEQFYSECRRVGNIYGPSFSMLQEARVNGNKANGTVKIPNITDLMPSKFSHPHLIHPTTLDTIFQLGLPLYLRHYPYTSIMPVSIDQMSISASMTHEPGTDILVETNLVPLGFRAAVVSTTAFQRKSDFEMTPVVSISGGELCGLGETQVQTSTSRTQRLITHEMEWKPDITLNQPFKLTETSEAREDATYAEDKERLLTQSASLYIKSVLERLTHHKAPVVAKHYQLLIDWMNGYVKSNACNDIVKAGCDEDTIHANANEAGVEGEMISRIGPQLLDILTGKTEPLSVMLENGLLYRVYADDSSVRCYSHLIEYLQQLAFKKPYLRVLEIGAGTGGTTFPLLKAHTNHRDLFFKSYDYTDISSGFFEQVHSKFEAWTGLIQFRTLDIERDPVQQGFEEASYDLIIASNVIHATKYLGVTLANVRRLLKPEGQLALLEIVNLTPLYMMTFGLLPGWWAGIDDGRENGPLLSVVEWNNVLTKAGFEGTETVLDDREGYAHRSSVMISGLKAKFESQKHLPVNILTKPNPIASSNDLTQGFATEIEKAGFLSNLTSWPSAENIDDSIYVFLDIDEEALLLNPSPEDFTRISALLNRASRIMWITGGHSSDDTINARKGLVTGFARIARRENVALRLLLFDVQEKLDFSNPQLIQAITSTLHRCLSRVGVDSDVYVDMEYTFHDGQVFIPRLLPAEKVNATALAKDENNLRLETSRFHEHNRALCLRVEKPGLLDSCVFVDDENAKNPVGADEILIKVMACGVNFKDVFISLGQMKPGTRMAGECSGTVSAVGSKFRDVFKIGDRVCAFAATPFASQARVQGYNAHKIPTTMSFPEAASIPVVFATAYHGLIDVARLQVGQTLLIHAASGGVGQAAIKLARSIGAEIFATVSSAEKCQLLIDLYQIPRDHIFSSRTRQFAGQIMRLTNGKGVDVVLNSLSGETLHATWNCLAEFGTFVEIGKSDIYKKSQLRMDVFDRNVTFASIDLSVISISRPTIIQRALGEVMAMFADSSLTPVEPINIMEIGHIEHAFRLIQSRKHTGKIVLIADDEATVKAKVTRSQSLSLDNDATYIVAGGLGDLGRHIAKFLASRGAGHIILLSRRSIDSTEEKSIASDFASLGAQVHFLKCDITNEWQVEKILAECQASLPPVRGVIQAAMILNDRLIGQMSTTDLRAALLPKVDGTRNLLNALNAETLESFIMLSSLTNIIGIKGQANYAAGNAFQDYLANYHKSCRAQYISLNLGMIEDSDVIASHPERIPGLLRAGCVPFNISQFLSLLGYCLSPQARQDRIKQIVIGVDRESLSAQEDNATLQNPMFSSMSYVSNVMSSTQGGKSSKKIEQLLAEAGNPQAMLNIISSGIASKIAGLMAQEQNEISLDAPLAELGLDSLIAIELKNWISGSLRAAMQTSEILDMPSITVLAEKILKKSTLVTNLVQPRVQENEEVVTERNGMTATAELSVPPLLPQLPLPELEHSLDLYVEAMTPFCSSDDLAVTRNAVSEFLEPNSLGQELQKRLLQRLTDPQIDAWQFDLYTKHVYLNARAPVNPFQQFGGSFSTKSISYSQAVQAAMISTAMYEFKIRAEADNLGPDQLNGIPLCMSSLEWIFNATREPHAQVDQMQKYSSCDFMIVLRRGHILKVELSEDSRPVNYRALKSTFDTILDHTHKAKTSLATLTADDRNGWSKVREMLEVASPDNKAFLREIEACSFIVCLDDGSPSNSSDRWNQWLLSGASNRWSDKTTQIVVCENGVSGLVVEHSMIDGGTLEQLNEHICRRLAEYRAQSPLANGDGHLMNGHSHRPAPFTELSFTLTSAIESHIERVQASYDAIVTPLACEVFNFTLSSFSEAFLRTYGVSPKAGAQLVIQLAARLYFGYSPPSWETVSMRPFHKGRVDIIQTALPEVVGFCQAALDAQIQPAEKRERLMNAAQAHTVNLVRASRGRGFAGHLYALQEVRMEGETEPCLFTDPVYSRTRPAKIMTDCTEWTNETFLEGGWVMPDPEHVWVHYEVGDGGCNFFIKTPKTQAVVFTEKLKEAVNLVAAILTH